MTWSSQGLLLLVALILLATSRSISPSQELKTTVSSNQPLQIDEQLTQTNIVSIASRPLRIGYYVSQSLPQFPFIQSVLVVAIRYFSSTLNLTHPDATPTRSALPLNCLELDLPPFDQVISQHPDPDLLILVATTNETGVSYTATGKSCAYHPLTGRPTLGRILLNRNSQAFQQRIFTTTLTSTLHEFVHILGFDRQLYPKYLDPRTGFPYQSPTQTVSRQDFNPDGMRKNATLLYLVTPTVRSWVSEHFACQSIPGALLENQGSLGSAGSHFQRRLFHNELMTATNLGPRKIISGLTLALLQDTGWYYADYSRSENLSYGYKRGCSFLQHSCKQQSSKSLPKIQFEEEYCAVQGRTVCSSDYRSAALCLGHNTYADGCRIRVPSGFICPNSDEICVESNLNLNLTKARLFEEPKCMKYTCIYASKTVSIQINDKVQIDCQSDNRMSFKGMFGQIRCPRYSTVCPKRPDNFNDCSQKGIFINHKCICIKGLSGSRCQNTNQKSQRVQIKFQCLFPYFQINGVCRFL